MGKSKTPEERAAKEARKLEKPSKKGKKGDSSKPTDTQEGTSGLVLVASESHDVIMEDEPVIEEVKKEKKLRRKRRLEQEQGLMDATVDTTATESTDSPKKRKKHKRAEEGEPAVVADEPAADLEIEKIASSSRKGEKKSKKEKTRKREDLDPTVEEQSADRQFPEDGPSSESASIKDGKKKKKKAQEIPNEEDTSSSPKKKRSKSHLSGSTSTLSPTSPPKPRKNRTDFPDPHADQSLTDQARKALDYAFLQFNEPSEWKFNKAKQNWLIRNVWSSEAIPDNYLRLATKYLTQVQGGSRDKLKETCKAAIAEPLPSPAPANDELKDTKPSDTPEEADDSSKNPKSILKGPAHPIAGAIIASVPEAPRVTVDTKKQRAQALIEALGFSS